MTNLWSGYQNSRTNFKKSPKFTWHIPTYFVINRKGDLIYQDKKFWDSEINKDLIRTLSDK